MNCHLEARAQRQRRGAPGKWHRGGTNLPCGPGSGAWLIRVIPPLLLIALRSGYAYHPISQRGHLRLTESRRPAKGTQIGSGGSHACLTPGAILLSPCSAAFCPRGLGESRRCGFQPCDRGQPWAGLWVLQTGKAAACQTGFEPD